ncbi:procathepsin L-like [Lepisosteus oculatus]|uniref:procathepsin L-like n=1 Tax=Lepisosteus oculatus TaxID=7918 RepID=UPI0035F50869
MKLIILSALCIGVVHSASLFLQDFEFEKWKLKHGRNYSSPVEESRRKETWLSNLKLVIEHNTLADLGLKSYRLGMTAFADMDNEEYKHMMFQGCLGHFNTTKAKSGFTFQAKDSNVLDSVDWRTMGYVTGVKNQLSCGSCWAFSATGSLEGQHFRATGKLVSLSEQQLVDCSRAFGNYGCGGGLMDQAFLYIKAAGGIDTEDFYPYEARDSTCRFSPNTIGSTCSGYFDVVPRDESTLQSAVAIMGPVSVGIDAGNPSFQLYKSGIYDEPGCSSTSLNHGVLVVGYGTESTKDYWIVKNSWGVSWGENGYIRMSRNKHNQCGIASLASYPLV